MSIDLSSDLVNEIQRHVATPEEVVREALAVLGNREPEVLAIQQGLDEMEAGQGRKFHEFDRTFRQRNSLPTGDQG